MPAINLPYHRHLGDFLVIFSRLATHLLLQSAGDRASGKQRQQPTRGTTMTKCDFNKDKKWCDECNGYQRYLMSVNHSFCAECGSQVRLFSKADSLAFGESLQKRRWGNTGS
jgi:hypothetical protein